MTVSRRTFDTVDLDLGTGRVLRVGVTRNEDGSADRLVIVPVWKDGGADHRHRVDVDASVLPQLQAALGELAAMGGDAE